MPQDDEFSGTEQDREANSSGPILSALKRAEKEFYDWQCTCHDIDSIYSLDGDGYAGVRAAVDDYGWQDTKLDLFWASFEVLKPAVYAKPPVPAIAPVFKDNSRLKSTTSELLERCSISSFIRSDIDDVMIQTRDDLLFNGRGVIWVRYETDDGQKVCYDHLDRTDFLHEPARKWSEVGWVAGGFWLTRKEMEKRFDKLTEAQLDQAQYTSRRDDDHSTDPDSAVTQKCRVWEVWHKADNKVYWVTEGIDQILDESEPQLKLSGFFPCPRPAYGTLKRRSLIPVPDWERYAIHFRKISELTGRIYLLLDSVKMKGLIPAGGEVGDSIEMLMASDDDQMLIPVTGAALLSGGTGNFVQWMPLGELAQAIQGLIAARDELINKLYELSGISDIMRGATEANETLGAQQLKSQYGSVRVREKIDELQRIARDVTRITSEIIAEHFSKDNVLDMAQMELPTKKDITDRIKEIEKAAEDEMQALTDKVTEAQGQDPQQLQMAFQQGQQQIAAKYAPMLEEMQNKVTVEEVMDLLRDDKARSFAFEVETDSTIMTDELQEKASRNEFLNVFTNASQGLMQMAAMGEQGAKLAGEMMKFVLAPYRVGRQLDGAIEQFIDAAPQMAAAAAQEGGDTEALAEANNKLAEAEMEKARAQMAKVESDNQLKQAENERKMAELQQKAQKDQMALMAEQEKLRQANEANMVKAEEALAKVDLIRAQTMKAMAEAGVTISDQQLDEFKSLADIEIRTAELQNKTRQQQVDNTMRVRGAQEIDQ